MTVETTPTTSTLATLEAHHPADLVQQSALPSDPPNWTAASDSEELRLVIAHYRTALRSAATLARNSVLTNSPDVEGWREDMQRLADSLERDLAA